MKFTLTFFILLAFTSFANAQFSIDIEGGAATFGYNDVRIPGNSGTLFSIPDNLSNTWIPFYRTRISYAIRQRHVITALYAPLTIKSDGVLNAETSFRDELFQPATRTYYEWKFNSYRLSYQYNVVSKEKIIFGIGVTAKIRDAKIALSNSSINAEKTNVGFVPLIRIYTEWQFKDRFYAILDADALVGKQGRAEDVLIALGYNINRNLRVKAGYRLLEGGADNDEVYNFSSVHYASLGGSWTFRK